MPTLARVLLGSVFLVSGTLKLRDRSWPAAARSLGVPAPMVGFVAPSEIALGALTAAGIGGPSIVWLALAVLVAFTLVLASALTRTGAERPVCACFGRWSARPVDGWSVMRNLAFVCLAVVALVW